MRVLTWNLWWRFGDWQQRADAIASVLCETRPDVVGLQEVWATDAENQGQQLADTLGLHWAWSPSPDSQRWQRRAGQPGVEVGNAVLSRWPLLEQERRLLPAARGTAGDRTVLHTLIDAPGGTLPFFTTHLDAATDGSATRCRQVEAVARLVADHPGDRPAVVTGDLNAEPESDELRLLGGHLTAPPVAGLVLVDAWRWAPDGDPGWTWDRRNPHINSSPSARIDYVLVGLGADVADVRLVGDEPVDGVWASDHAAVLADLI
ncbi:MAG TPA: endonuclease/exonuclease/phosphatase family protein [Actinomycetales bacterium]|nr:endonuclease/exonuclease/phosphatase family protein [Actinomycetales bacterium]